MSKGWEEIGKKFLWVRPKRGIISTHIPLEVLIAWSFLTLQETGEFSLPRSPIGKVKGFGKQVSLCEKGK